MTPDLSAFGSVQRLEPLPGGHRNQVFQVQLDGRDLVAKSTARSEAAMTWVTELMDLAARCGIVVPKMLHSASGSYVSNGWTLETWCDGRPAEARDHAAFRDPLRALHVQTQGWPQRPGLAVMADLLAAARAGDVDLTALPAPVAATCRDAWSAVADAPRCAVHGDVGLGNMRIAPDGRPVLVDWDEARVDAAFLDFVTLDPELPLPQRRAHLAWEVACGWQREPEHAAACLEALQRL